MRIFIAFAKLVQFALFAFSLATKLKRCQEVGKKVSFDNIVTLDFKGDNT